MPKASQLNWCQDLPAFSKVLDYALTTTPINNVDFRDYLTDLIAMYSKDATCDKNQVLVQFLPSTVEQRRALYHAYVVSNDMRREKNKHSIEWRQFGFNKDSPIIAQLSQATSQIKYCQRSVDAFDTSNPLSFKLAPYVRMLTSLYEFQDPVTQSCLQDFLRNDFDSDRHANCNSIQLSALEPAHPVFPFLIDKKLQEPRFAIRPVVVRVYNHQKRSRILIDANYEPTVNRRSAIILENKGECYSGVTQRVCNE